ncbi:uncharacterized protein CC84DRAFT_655750 [Paraphaeosphaeria sporulosa]|uniref:Uncharacterized protein n=1 Tax=Paraphaeosphaeria sporulosa TaxID=1460663 RepID=A0A177CJE4_9PLEO|nr:uncharacterized protein CC84DRAFT_655750 [Paraphaeosphaeria sporulosa]OAG07381.1 hypothetical protein CC84DRAFT_655750 [Paraphaeosphaeria sporulosa]
MFIVLCSVVLTIIPIFLVQYQRFLTSIPAPEQFHRLPERPAGLKVAHNRGNASFDGPACDTTSEGPSDRLPIRAVTISGYETRETRKPWDPPFPTRPRTLRDLYLVLPRSEDKGRERMRRPTSQVPPEEDDGIINIAQLPVTDLPTSSAPIPPPMLPRSHVQESQSVVQSGYEDRQASTQTTTERKPTTTGTSDTLLLVQKIVLALALIIFVFAFAILVAHCMAWFVVYKTEARLGDVRKGLLRGGDMRVCLCAR